MRNIALAPEKAAPREAGSSRLAETISTPLELQASAFGLLVLRVIPRTFQPAS